jgi:hypothetical protein
VNDIPRAVVTGRRIAMAGLVVAMVLTVLAAITLIVICISHPVVGSSSAVTGRKVTDCELCCIGINRVGLAVSNVAGAPTVALCPFGASQREA